jgi:hypothetical protein
VVQLGMRKSLGLWPFLTLAFVFVFFASVDLYAQRERQLEPPPASEYGTKFFDQLRTLFGRFRDSDLQRAFDSAGPVPCSELISDNGEWREVAFFNEDRRLGDWFHQSLESVKSDLSVYIFKGLCRSDRSNIQLVTKFPVRESLDAYNDRRIDLQQIIVNVNAPVVASFDPRTEAYAFDLPYLYAVQDRNTAATVYSLSADYTSDRYDQQVTNHWECKAVHAPDVTFQFMVCRTSTMPKSRAQQERFRPAYGSSAFFILSDGREASTSVKLSFGTGDDSHPQTTIDVPSDRGTSPTTRSWLVAEAAGRFVELSHGEFRIRFNPSRWMSKASETQVLLDGGMSGLAQARAPAGADYCIWNPASNPLVSRVLDPEPEKYIANVVTLSDGSRVSPVSVSFEMKSDGSRLGTLQCFFPRADSAGAISFDRWNAIVGDNLTLEVRP